MSTSTETIELIDHGRWAVIKLHLSGDTNAVNQDFAKAFMPIIEKYETDEQIRALVVTAEGPYFSNGFEPEALLDATPDEADAVVGAAFRVTQRFHKLPCITIMAINGHAMGMGAVLSLFADYRYMIDKKARFGFPEALIGMALPHAPCMALQDLVGHRNARNLAISGKGLKPADALEMGLVDGVYSAEELLPRAEKFAASFAKMPRISIVGNKMGLRFRYDDGALDKAWERDIESARVTTNSEAQEGLKSILEGRRPVFD